MNKYLTLDSSKGYHDENITYWHSEVVEPKVKSLKTVTIGDLLNNEPDGYNKLILLDLHRRIIELNNQPWNDDLFQQLPTLLEQVTILECEIIYRYAINDNENEVRKKYPNLVNTGMFHLISIYGWLLPYFMDSKYYKSELDKLPPIPTNLRPITKDELIHPFALHHAHSMLAFFEKAYTNINDGANVGHNPIKKELKAIANELASEIWQDDKKQILKNVHVASIIRTVLYNHSEYRNYLPNHNTAIKEWIKPASPTYAGKSGRATNAQQNEIDDLINELETKYTQRQLNIFN